MEGGAGGDTIQDWELLPGSGSDVVNPENSGENLRNYDEIEGDCSGGMIRLDYFSLDNENRYSKTSLVDVSEEGSIESDNPSWIDPGSETPYQRKNSGEFWSDSGSDRSDERKFGDFEGKNEMGFVENGKSQVGTEGAGEILGIGDFDVKIELGLEGKLKGEVGSEGYGESQFRDKHLGRFWSDSGGDELVSRSSEGVEKVTEVGKEDESEVFGESEGGNGSKGANSSVEIQEMKGEVKSVGVEGTGRIAWWKVPFEVLKYCVLKVNPVWSFSVAAAMLGLVMLGRRLYKMKRKSNSLQLKVTLDDKKVSQFMTRAARLNEAFSVVRRVPIIRPALPAGGVNPWPVMSIR